MKNTFLIWVASVLASSVAFSQVAEQLLTRDILASQKLMASDVKIYTYFWRDAHPSLNSLEGRHEFAQRVLSSAAGSFWNMDFQDASPKNFACGPGLYFAIDPNISKQYGNSFLEMTISKGTRYITVVNAITINNDTMAALQAESFFGETDKAVLFPPDKPTGKRGFYRDTLRAMVMPQYIKFRKMVQKIFSENNIQFIEYNFNTSLSGFCKSAKTSAFLFVGAQNPSDSRSAKIMSEFSDVDMYSTEVFFQNQTAQEMVRLAEIAKFRTLLTDMADLRAQKIGIPKTMISDRYSAQEIKEIKSQTFSCQ